MLPCCFGRDANPRTARRTLVRLRVRVFYISRQINLGPLGFGLNRDRALATSVGVRRASRGLGLATAPRFLISTRPDLLPSRCSCKVFRKHYGLIGSFYPRPAPHVPRFLIED